MLTFKQRYRPRTEREYTKTDLTVYDSAGNTALRGLKVYGKSEIIEGEIVSAGDSGNITIISNNNTPNLITSIIQGAVSSSGGLLPDNTTRVMTTPIYIEPNTEIFLNSNSVAQVYEVNEWDENDNFLGYYGINSTSGSRIVRERTHKIIVTFRYSNNGNITPEVVPNATITLTPRYTTTATFSTGTPLYGINENTRDVMGWNGSAGEVTKNCGEMDLGTLTWTYDSQYTRFISSGISTVVKKPETDHNIAGIICPIYVTTFALNITTTQIDMAIAISDMGTVSIRNTNFTNAALFKSAMSGVTLIYELATPTTEQLTQTENDSIASLRTFDGPTHFTNNASTDMTINYTIKVPTIS